MHKLLLLLRVINEFNVMFIITWDVVSQSLLSFGCDCDCVWKLVRVRISAEIRSIVRMNELTLTI